MILYTDFLVSDEVHLEVNRGLIEIFFIIFPDLKHCLFSEKKHGEKVKSKLKNINQSKFKQINTLYINSKNRFIRSFNYTFIFVLNLIKLYIISKRNKPKLLIFLTLSPFQHYLLHKIFPINQNCIILFHSELELLLKKNKKKLSQGYWFQKTYDLPPNKPLYLVLGSPIKEQLYINSLFNKNKVIAINHPYDFSLLSTKSRKSDGILRIGAIGQASSYKKNTHLMFELAKKVQQLIKTHKVELYIVGKIESNMSAYLNNLVIFNDRQDFLPSEEFNRQVNNLDCIVYFYTKNEYNLAASGALFDAIKFKKEILTLNNNFISYYVDKYNIGKVFDTTDEMAYYINNCHQKIKTNILKNNYEHFMRDHSYFTIARDLLISLRNFNLDK